jgi:ATP-binding cassette, subfamily B, bacterial
MKLTIDVVSEGFAAQDKSSVLAKLLLYVGLIGVTVLLNNALSSLNSYLSEKLSLKAEDHLSDRLHRKSTTLDLQYYENPDYFDTLHRAQQGAIQRPAAAFKNSTQLLQNSLSLIGMLVLLLTFHWSVSLLLIAAVIPGVVFRLKFSQRLYRWDRSKTSTQRHANYYHFMLTGDYYAKEIRLFQLGPLFIKRFHDLRVQLREEKLSIAQKRTIAEVGANLATILAVYGSFGFMAWRAVYGFITIGDLVMYYQAFQRGLNYFKTLLTNAAGLYEDSLYLSNLFEFLSLKATVKEPENPLPIFKTIEKGISVQDLSFSYPASDRDVLREVSFQVQPGEHVALVGENGAGKTTLIKLLCRLYDPTTGSISIDGVDARSFQSHELRRQISVVFQDFVRYHLRVKDNIRFGNTELDENDARIIESAKASDIDEVIRSLPQGYDTTLGKMFEHGEELSIGEWQKIALARAFLRDVQIIILDEPTSALDAKSEFEIFKKFQELARGKTAFLISHRLSTAKLADRILVLNKGSIAEDGSHDELIKQNGIYTRMFQMQSQYYK